MADFRPIRIAVLISGSGSNLQSLMDHCAAGKIPGEIVLVLSDREDAFGLIRARNGNIPAHFIDPKKFPDRNTFNEHLSVLIEAAQVDLVCLAGFMRILSQAFVQRHAGRLINIHPSLLPSFPGLNVQQRAIDAGARFSGATVHFVTEEVDAGPIIVQAVVPILPDDDASTLAARILKQEHVIYPLAVRLFAERRLVVAGQRVIVVGRSTTGDASSINPPLSV